MATYAYTNQNASQRPVAMALALVSAVALSPLYINRRNESRHEHGWSTSLVLPVVLGGLIVAIKTTSSSSVQRGTRTSSIFPSPDASSVLRIGSTSWGLAGILLMLMFVLSWQSSVKHFLWR